MKGWVYLVRGIVCVLSEEVSVCMYLVKRSDMCIYTCTCIHSCALSHTHAVRLLHGSSGSLSLLSSAASSTCGLDTGLLMFYFVCVTCCYLMMIIIAVIDLGHYYSTRFYTRRSIITNISLVLKCTSELGSSAVRVQIGS